MKPTTKTTQRKLERLAERLKKIRRADPRGKIREAMDYDDAAREMYRKYYEVGPDVLIRKGTVNAVLITGEDGLGWVDYYDGPRETDGLDAELHAWLAKNNLEWEWENPGAIAVYI